MAEPFYVASLTSLIADIEHIRSDPLLTAADTEGNDSLARALRMDATQLYEWLAIDPTRTGVSTYQFLLHLAIERMKSLLRARQAAGIVPRPSIEALAMNVAAAVSGHGSPNGYIGSDGYAAGTNGHAATNGHPLANGHYARNGHGPPNGHATTNEHSPRSTLSPLSYGSSQNEQFHAGRSPQNPYLAQAESLQSAPSPRTSSNVQSRPGPESQNNRVDTADDHFPESARPDRYEHSPADVHSKESSSSPKIKEDTVMGDLERKDNADQT